MPNPVLAPLLGWLGRVSHPRLFMLAGALFAITLVVPDPLPFVDELLLGVATLLISRIKRRPPPGEGARKGQGRVIEGEARRG